MTAVVEAPSDNKPDIGVLVQELRVLMETYALTGSTPDAGQVPAAAGLSESGEGSKTEGIAQTNGK